MTALRLAAVAGTVLAVSSVPAAAQSTAASSGGFDYLHKQARVGSLVCMTEHSHYGQGGPYKVRRVAERRAIAAWSAFTAEEYGAQWGRYERAAGRKMDCTTSTDGGTTYYTCGAHGRPCRPAR